MQPGQSIVQHLPLLRARLTAPVHVQYVAMTKDASEALTERAQAVMMRMLHKLEGRDFRFDGINPGPISVADQVQKLIAKATNNELLCQSYIGWCPFW